MFPNPIEYDSFPDALQQNSSRLRDAVQRNMTCFLSELELTPWLLALRPSFWLHRTHYRRFYTGLATPRQTELIWMFIYRNYLFMLWEPIVLWALSIVLDKI
jgi:hypothetical protein